LKPSFKHPNLINLQSIFKKYSDIEAVYIFGSTASGKRHQDSDIDLAIVPASKELREKKLSILTDLARVGFCNVDLVFLDTDDVVLKYEAIRKNNLIYKKEGFDRGALYSKIVRQYLDFLPYLNVQRQAYKKRLLSGKS